MQPLVIVVGDPILDVYVEGEATHICPEAPVPVLRVDRYRYVLGGSLNCAANVVAAGARCVALTHHDTFNWIDDTPRVLHEIITMSGDRPVHRKKRFLAQFQRQILRVDDPKPGPISKSQVDTAIDRMFACLNGEIPDLIVLSDYGCGIVTREMCEAISFVRGVFERNAGRPIPILLDPYPTTNPQHYTGIDLVKCNAHEASRIESTRSLLDLAHTAVVTHGRESAELHRMREGVRVVDRSIRPRDVGVVDVCGAGDVFMAYLAVGIAGLVKTGSDSKTFMGSIAASGDLMNVINQQALPAGSRCVEMVGTGVVKMEESDAGLRST